jgi:hypothetical protein
VTSYTRYEQEGRKSELAETELLIDLVAASGKVPQTEILWSVKGVRRGCLLPGSARYFYRRKLVGPEALRDPNRPLAPMSEDSDTTLRWLL